MSPPDLVRVESKHGDEMTRGRFLESFLRSTPLLLLLGVGGITTAVTFSKPGFSLPYSYQLDSITDSPKEVIDQVWQIVYRDYLDSSGDFNENSWRKLRSDLLSKSYLGTTESYEAIRGMLSSLDDPYTRFMDPKEFKEMQIDTSGELLGVGIQLSLDKETKELVVVSPIEGTPASRAGVQSKDVIVTIDGVSTEGMSTGDAVKLIRGPEGTSVVLGLRRDGDVIDFSLERARIEINAVESSLNTSPKGYKVGYIRLKQFNAKASREMGTAIKELENADADGYVLDLRSNPGGLLEASVEITRQWLNEGIIVSTKTREGIRDVRRATGSALTDKPLVILIDQGSASASEIVSGALQDNGRAILVGAKTYGKGVVQAVRGLADGSGMTVTVAKYLTPNGTDIHKFGIKPDIEALVKKKEIENFKIEDLGTEKDSQYVQAITALTERISLSEVGTTFQPGKTNLSYALQ